MLRQFILVCSACLLWSMGVTAVEYKLQFKKSIIVSNGYFTTDPIGNIYLVKDQNYIIKYNRQGDSLGVYNEVSLGDITAIDASNPLRVLVYYSGFNKIQILDNMLSLKNELDLTTLGLFNVPAIANSLDGNIWVFDPAGRLLKINEQLEIKHSYLLRNMIDFSVSPSHMVERERTLYMTDTSEGILQFDRYGFYRTIYRYHTSEMNMINNFLVYYKNGELISYNTKSLRTSTIVLPQAQNICNARFEKNQVYVLRKEQLDIYTLIENE